jgi:hypothetical protein
MAKKRATPTPAPAAQTASVDPTPPSAAGATVPATTSGPPAQDAPPSTSPVSAGTTTFTLALPLLADGRDYAIGDEIELTVRQHAEFRAVGVVTEDWPAES